MKRTWVAVALLLATTACGGDDEGAETAGPLAGDDKVAADSISAYWQRSGVEKKASICLGERMVREFGVAHLKDLEVLDAKLKAQDTAATAFKSDADAPKAATMIVDCLTLPGLMKQQYTGVDDATATCLADAFGRDRMVDAMAAQFQGTAAEDTPEDVTAEMSECVPNK